MQPVNPAQTFLIEASELLDTVEEAVLQVGADPKDEEAVNRLFRAFHTIKGSGAMFGYEAVADFTHEVETALDQVRQGATPVTPELVSLVLWARDHIQQLLSADSDALGGLKETSDRLAAELGAMCAKQPHAAVAPARGPAAPDTHGALATYSIQFRPNPDIAAGGLDPAALLEELRSLGRCTVLADTTQVPALETLEATKCWIGWNVILTTDRGLNAIKDVFIFAEDGAELSIEPVKADAANEPPGTSIPSATDGCGTTTSSDMGTRRPRCVGLNRAGDIAAPPQPADPVPTCGTQSVRSTGPAEVPIRSTEASASGGSDSTLKSIREAVVRVPSAKLDHIVSLIGELVMNESRLSQVSNRLNVPDLANPVEAIERLVAEMRDAVLGIRMMPIGSTFNRFKRLVHDLSRDLGREVDLVTEGAETELDKTVLDQLADPLVHLIRNSIDHGIGNPEERVAAGKPPRGTVRLTAAHAGSHVIVTISDDGRGLDAAVIRAKAVEKKLVAADAALTEAETFNLIFLPGFSTAKQVTAISGRGVGMDVVRKQIDALRGSIQLSSSPAGTTVSLALPLTLAIVEGLLVCVGNDPFIIPMSVVMENVELRREERAQKNGRNLIAVRGELIPYLHLRELFEVPGDEPAIQKIVIARFGRDRVGLVVDRVLGSHQTVIQSLGRMFKDIGVISGSTIMGDGRVALILDLPGVVAFAEQQCGTTRDAAVANVA